MIPEPPIPDRLKAGSPGLGEAADAEIERRAVELAMIDGRESFTDADLARAAEELAGGTPELPAPEADTPLVEEITAWDDPVEQDGGQTERTEFEDEGTVAEQLVQDGIEEADHDRRVAAAEDADPEDVAE